MSAFLDYGRLEWDHGGRAIWRHTREFPCPGPYWSKDCLGRYEDDYGSTKWCPTCTYGNGKVMVVRFIRVPRYDAPKPPKSWKGPGAKTINSTYKGVTP